MIMSKETFKSFVRYNPSLLEHFNYGSMTWQRFYEMYDVYGENSSVWNTYLNNGFSSSSNIDVERSSNNTANQSLLGDTSLKDLFNMVKTIDLDTVRRGIDGLTKAVNLVQDLSSSKPKEQQQSTYEARPMYKYFED